MTIDSAVRTQIDDLRADIALYQDGQPIAVVELKPFGDTRNALRKFKEDSHRVARYV